MQNLINACLAHCCISVNGGVLIHWLGLGLQSCHCTQAVAYNYKADQVPCSKVTSQISADKAMDDLSDRTFASACSA